MGRFFRNYKVGFRPVAPGGELSTGLKSLNDSIRPLYESYHIPTGFTNRICLGAAGFHWGGRDKEEDHVLAEQDFPTWTPNDLDRYNGGYQLGPGDPLKATHSHRDMADTGPQYGTTNGRRVWS